MLLCSLFLHLPNAVAAPSGAPIVLSVGDEIPTGLGGGWARAWPADDGTWQFLWSAGGDYVLLPMTADLTVTDFDRTRLTGRDNLVDHAITRCPDDGSFLHAASANLDAFNDSAYATRLSPDFVLTSDTTIEERVPTRMHNDLTVLCSGPLSGVGFAEQGGGSVFFPVAADATVGAPVALPDAAPLMGGAMYYEAETDTILAINFRFRGPLVVARYTTDLTLVDVTEIADAVEAPLTGYWAQGLLRVGDVYVVAHMARDESRGWAADEGDVWLTFFDTAWNVLERRQVSQNTPPVGGMRPGLARRGDQLLVLYDKEVSPRLFDVRLDLAAMGVEGDEADSGRSDAEDDSGLSGTDAEDAGGCGCDTGGAPLTGVGLLAALLVRRRREPSGG